MSENNFSYVKEDALLSIEIGGKYYHELKKVFMAMISDAGSADDIIQKMTNIAAGKVSSIQDHLLHLAYVMIMEIENKAVEIGMVEDKPLDINPESLEN